MRLRPHVAAREGVFMSKIIRKSLLAAALAAAACSVRSRFVLAADERMAGDHMKMASEKMAAEQMDKMKMMAADQAQAHEMTAQLARLMVMDRMAMQMAMDPKFKQMSMQTMSDPNMKMVHDEARKMADDPALTTKLQQEIMSDPKDMRMVMHMAHTMAMMHDGMMHD